MNRDGASTLDQDRRVQSRIRHCRTQNARGHAFNIMCTYLKGMGHAVFGRRAGTDTRWFTPKFAPANGARREAIVVMLLYLDA